MSLVKRRVGNRTYLYFKLPGPDEIYLGPADNIKPDRLNQALEYLEGRIEHYQKIVEELKQLARRPDSN